MICLTSDFLLIPTQLIGHLTVVCFVSWALIGSEAEGDLVLITNLTAFHCFSYEDATS